MPILLDPFQLSPPEYRNVALVETKDWGANAGPSYLLHNPAIPNVLFGMAAVGSHRAINISVPGTMTSINTTAFSGSDGSAVMHDSGSHVYYRHGNAFRRTAVSASGFGSSADTTLSRTQPNDFRINENFVGVRTTQTGGNRWHMVSVVTPTAPTEVVTLWGAQGTMGVINNQRKQVYIGDTISQSFQTFDWSGPGVPTQLGTSGSRPSIVILRAKPVDPNRVFIIQGVSQASLVTMDVTNDTPVTLDIMQNSAMSPVHAHGMQSKIVNNTLITCNGPYIDFFDITNPALGAQYAVSRSSASGTFPSDINVVGNRLFIAQGNRYVHEYELSV